MARKDVNMLSGSIVKGLLAISFPVMIMNVISSLYNIIDMTILKTFDTDGGIAVGAVGVCGTLITLITGLVTGVSTGANVVIAKHIGRKSQEDVDRTIATAMAFAITAGIGLAVIGITFADTFLSWTSCPELLMPQAVLYFRLYFAGVPILMVYNFCASMMRASGNSRQPMIFLIIGGAVKVASAYLFVGKFRLGVVGVAAATIVSWGLLVMMALTALIRSKGVVKVRLKATRFYKAELLPMLKIGVPAGLQAALYSVANVLISATVNSYGPQATTGISIANNFDAVLYNISTATSLAVLPYVSQNIGAKNLKRATQSVWKGTLITVALGASIGALFAIFSAQLSSIMSDDPVVIAYSQDKMIIVSSTYFILGIYEILGAALRAMGKPLVPTVATFMFMCVLRFVWVYFVYPLYPNLTFLYMVWPVGWVLCIITSLIFYFPTVKKQAKLLGVSPAAEQVQNS